MVEVLKEWFLSFAQTTNHPLGLALLFGASFLEYVFPPFPGDTVVIFGAVLVGAFGWNLWLVFGLVTVGSVLGAIVDYKIGHSVQKSPRLSGKLSRLIILMKKYGPVVLLANRFLPGIRPLFFVAAGIAGLPLKQVAAYSAVSAILWNILLVYVGYSVGANWDLMERWLSRYSLVMGGLIVLLAVIAFSIWWWRRRANQ